MLTHQLLDRTCRSLLLTHQLLDRTCRSLMLTINY